MAYRIAIPLFGDMVRKTEKESRILLSENTMFYYFCNVYTRVDEGRCPMHNLFYIYIGYMWGTEMNTNSDTTQNQVCHFLFNKAEN